MLKYPTGDCIEAATWRRPAVTDAKDVRPAAGTWGIRLS